MPTHAMRPHEWGTRCIGNFSCGPPAVWATRPPAIYGDVRKKLPLALHFFACETEMLKRKVICLCNCPLAANGHWRFDCTKDRLTLHPRRFTGGTLNRRNPYADSASGPCMPFLIPRCVVASIGRPAHSKWRF